MQAILNAKKAAAKYKQNKEEKTLMSQSLQGSLQGAHTPSHPSFSNPTTTPPLAQTRVSTVCLSVVFRCLLYICICCIHICTHMYTPLTHPSNTVTGRHVHVLAGREHPQPEPLPVPDHRQPLQHQPVLLLRAARAGECMCVLHVCECVYVYVLELGLAGECIS